ncbi:MAG: bifunctional phosphoglucose/phosphomannose isomerase [Ignavibacterium sp.]|nr:bifunctional phosphoglucose/phosphomannose isomerase [Ignavibacterium sp.]
MKIQEYVKKYDPQNQFDVLINIWKQIEFALNNKYDVDELNQKKFTNLVLTGLGGSAISGDLLRNYLHNEIKVPFIVNRNYSLPSFADENTLLIVSSYSGNTEETISVLNQAIKAKCSILVLTTGGEAEKIAFSHKLPVIKLQKGFQPRYALGLSFFSLLIALDKIGVISNQKSEIEEVLTIWKKKASEYSSENNMAFSLAERMIGFIPVIYSISELTSAAGYRFKCQLNENSKLHAFHHEIPEMNHNEIIGWETYQEKSFPVKVIYLLDENCHPQIKKRFQFMSEILCENKIDVIALNSSEKSFKARLMDLIYLCDWITFYIAVQRGYDPSEIDNINKLKERL